MKAFRPPMKWSENKDVLRIIIDLRDIKDEEINFETQKLTVSCSSWQKNYREEMDLLKEIDTEKSKFNKTAFNLEIVLKKKESEKWNKVTKNDKKFTNMTVDWDHFENSELSEEEEQDPMSKFGGMGGMPGMGGMGGMPGMGGMGGMPGMGGLGGMPGMGGGMPDMNKMKEMMEQMKNMKGMEGLGKMGDMPVGEDSDDDSDDEPATKLDDLEGNNEKKD